MHKALKMTFYDSIGRVMVEDKARVGVYNIEFGDKSMGVWCHRRSRSGGNFERMCQIALL